MTNFKVGDKVLVWCYCDALRATVLHVTSWDALVSFGGEISDRVSIDRLFREEDA